MKRISLLAFMHFIVDMICAIAVYGRFASRMDAGAVFLLYNFAAFALQMPSGIILDAIVQKTENASFYGILFAAAGCLCCLAGAFCSLILLGTGNALFHVGGGLISIYEDDCRQMKGAGLGAFVAPGAIGLYLGTRMGKASYMQLLLPACILVCLFALCMLYGNFRKPVRYNLKKAEFRLSSSQKQMIILCFLTVVLRSYAGLSIRFAWNTSLISGLLLAVCTAAGKALGGFAGARKGIFNAAYLSLGMSAVFWLASSMPAFGCVASLLFNMTMPLTLYLLYRSLPAYPASAFGLLTFALFIGFVPVLYGFTPETGGNVIGMAASVISLILFALMKRNGDSL